MHTLASKLGEAHAGPKDVVDVHTAALKLACEKESLQREEALTTEGRILLVQLMGYLCGYYRNRSLKQNAVNRTRKKQS
jgi:hypothetical protein